MTKISVLNNQLNSLMKNISKIKNFENMSMSDFKNYKKLLKQRNLIKQKINNYEKLKLNLENIYNSKNTKWLYDDSLNCRKYCRLEKYASYKKEKGLYKLGYLPKKPLFPLLKSIKEHFEIYYLDSLVEKKNFLLNHFYHFFISTKEKSPIYQNLKKFQKYKTEILPKKINRFAINRVKQCICGYRKFNYSIQYFSAAMKYKNMFHTFNNIYAQAKKELDSPNSFRKRIVVTPRRCQPHIQNLCPSKSYEDLVL